MVIIQDNKSDVDSIHDNPNENTNDLPPAYDALSLHGSTSYDVNQHTGESAFPSPVAGSSRGPFHSHAQGLNLPVSNVDKSLPSPPPQLDNTLSSPINASPASTQKPRTRKNTSWFSLLPFASSLTAKRVRQSALSIISDLVIPPSRTSNAEQKNAHEILASVAETCAEYKVSLSGILREAFIADHTPMYWAIVNYRQELLVALLVHSRPLSIQAISDIRRACLISSNQALFHALRVCRPPFHKTDGIQVPSLRTGMFHLLPHHLEKLG